MMYPRRRYPMGESQPFNAYRVALAMAPHDEGMVGVGVDTSYEHEEQLTDRITTRYRRKSPQRSGDTAHAIGH